ncbi:hypothetical protein, partial [Staphylococcus haemolyticus]|uniref:hypothetical protein n=1 Tax=Staphylococcus haemolyticus TaxID=1283 RepID=UPI0021B4176A
LPFLVPTTILPQQHYQTLIQPMHDFPLQIQFITPFPSTKQLKQTKQPLKSPYLHILLPTHKLLPKHIHYKHLRLLILH